MDHALTETLEQGVLTLTLNRPERLNAFNPEMLLSLDDCLRRAATNRDVGALVVAGTGRAFCAGGDVKAMSDGGSDESFDEQVQSLRRRVEVVRLLREMPKPSIAMLRGAVAGAGTSLALACDLRIASDTLKFTTAFAKVALSPDFGGSYFLTRLVGSAKARELYFTSPVLSGATALSMGLVNRVVADVELESETKALAQSLAGGPRIALGFMKETINLAERADLAEVLSAEVLRHICCARTEDHREAAAAFVEKRAPFFRGR